MPKSPFPDPACRLPDEYGLLAAVLASPDDDLPKLVYADFLEERSDPRGPFLRHWVAFRNEGQGNPKPPRGVSRCWLSVIRHSLAKMIEYNPTWDEAVWQTAEPGILVSTKPHTGKKPLPVGASKMGGFPDLPPDFPPSEGMTDGPPAFVAQWNLEELALSPVCRSLPKTGLLSFAEGDGMMVVIYFPDLSVLERRTAKDEYHLLPECRVEFREWLTLPHPTSPRLAPFRLTTSILADYRHFYGDYESGAGSPQILGHPLPLDRDPSPDARGGWRLLTQFGPDPRLDFVADGGAWYHMIREDDLKRAHFDDVYAESQSG